MINPPFGGFIFNNTEVSPSYKKVDDMSEENEAPEVNEEESQAPTELDTLKARAKQMGIQFHPNIGLEKLKLKVNKAITSDEPEEDAKPAATPKAEAKIKTVKKESKIEKERRLRKDAGKLVRVVVNCMNPNKREHEGELISVGNAIVGQFQKFIPFNNEEGWHIPNIIYKHLLERECQTFITVKLPNGQKVRKGKMIKEFSVTVLPPLSETALKELRQKQAMANSID
jgi:hypothetical protein